MAPGNPASVDEVRSGLREALKLVAVALKEGGAPFALKIHMTQVPDGYWRIDRIANMKELRALEEQEEAAPPANGRYHQRYTSHWAERLQSHWITQKHTQRVEHIILAPTRCVDRAIAACYTRCRRRSNRL